MQCDFSQFVEKKNWKREKKWKQKCIFIKSVCDVIWEIEQGKKI